MKVIISVVYTLVSVGASMSYAQSVWVVGSMPRIGPSDAPASGSSISLYAAKGEAESLQVVVRAPAGGLSQVNLTASDLTGPGGATISKQNLTFYREYYVYVGQSSPDFGIGNRPLGVGWYPDGLIPFKDPATGLDLTGQTLDAVPYNIPGNQNQPFWVDINVPRSATAGTYTGTITVTSIQGSWTVGVGLQVWNFTLPVASRLKSSFGLHNLGNMANNQVLLQHRIQPFTINPSDFPTVTTYGAEIVGLPFFNQSSGCTINPAPPSSTLASAMTSYPGFPTYVYPADEVTGCANVQQSLQSWAQAAHSAGTKTLVTVVPDPTLLDDGTGTGRSDVDIWGMLPKQYCANLNQVPCNLTPSIPVVLAKGGEIWMYNEEEQDYYSPKWLIDFAPINYRISPGFINQQFGATGMLYSYVAGWSSDPWNNVNEWAWGGYSFPGDDILVYPGQQVGLSFVQPSMRLKYLRDGVDDYDYMAMLKDQGQGALVQQVLASIAPDWHNWTKEPVALENARIQLGQELDQLAGGGASTLQAPSSPSPADGSISAATTLTIQWSTVSGAAQYQVYFGSSSTSLSLYAKVNAPTTSTALTNLNAGATYYWKVVAIAGSSSASSAVWSFTTPGGVTLSPPSILSPLNGSTTTAPDTTIQWSAVSGATQYQVYLGSSSTSLYNIGTLNAPTTNTALNNLAAGATYYWKVTALAGSSSANSALSSFKTRKKYTQTLSSPTVVWPLNGSTGSSTTLTVQWSPVTGATQYQVYFGSGSSSLALYATVNAPSVNAAFYNLSRATTYYWKVVAIAGSSSASGAVWSFMTN